MEERIISVYRFLLRNWNAILAAISVIGVIILKIVPQQENYRDFFLFLGLNAVVWTLIEIKVKLQGTEKRTPFRDLMEARPHILNALRREMSRPRAHLDIRIIGGRIRTISDMLRELRSDVEHGRIRGKNITITVLCIHPEFMSSWGFPPAFLSKKSLSRNLTYSGIVTKLNEELTSYNTLRAFRNQNIRLKVRYYRTVPSVYCFVIEDQEIFWGSFTWNEETQDFEGPTNPCFSIRRADPEFIDTAAWLHNHFRFLVITGTATS